MFAADPFGTVTRCAELYGDMFTLRLHDLGNGAYTNARGNGAWVFLCTPGLLETMYADDPAIAGAAANKIFFGTDEASLGYIDGEVHRRRRAYILPSFGRRVDYGSIVVAAVDQWLAKRVGQWPLLACLQELTSSVIVEVVCGEWPDPIKDEIARTLPTLEDEEQTEQSVIAADRRLRELLTNVLSERGPGQDVAGVLTRHAREDPDLADALADEVLGLLYTGFATTANTLAWYFLRIAQNQPSYVSRLAGTFDARPPILPNRHLLAQVDAALSETLRLHPVSAMNGVRMVNDPIEIGGFLLPAGTILAHCAYVVQRDPRNYPDPEVFAAERFWKQSLPRHTWGAFGGGDRTCVGRGYARTQMQMMAALVHSRGRIEVRGDLPRARLQGIFMGPPRDQVAEFVSW